MAVQLNKTGVTFPGFRLSTFTDDGGVAHYFLDVGYQVQTAEGEVIGRDVHVELNGAAKTTVANFFTTVTNTIKQKEGIP